MKAIMVFIYEIPAWRDYMADFLIWCAKGISRDVRHEQIRLEESFQTCLLIAGGEFETLGDARVAASATVY